MQLRLQSGETMVSERMLMPKWAQVAARRLSDEQLSFKQNEGGHAYSHPPSNPPGLSESNHAPDSGIAKSSRESVAGTVSRKGKFGFVCEKCSWVPYKGDPEDWIDTGKGGFVGLHFPDRCKKCRSRMKRWTCAARNYDKLELLRLLEGRHCLRFVTFTREEWNITLPLWYPKRNLADDYTCDNKQKEDNPLSAPKLTVNSDNHNNIESAYNGLSGPYLWEIAEKLKRSGVKKFNNWRNRNKYWKSREAKGQAYYEVTMKPVWNGWGWDEVQLHFHIHTVVCSKRLENKDIQIDLDTLEPIPMSTTMQREWGGVVDVRACKTWKHKDGEMKTSKRFVMNYLVDYINKSPHWQSTKFGDWSN